MIRLNLMRNQFGGSSSKASREPSPFDLEFDSQENFAVRSNRKPLWIALAACLVALLGGGIWWFTTNRTEQLIPGSSAERAESTAVAATSPSDTPALAPTPLDTPKAVVADTVQPKPADPALAAAARAESLKVAEQARKDSVATATNRKNDSLKSAKQRREDSLKLAKQRKEDSIKTAKQRREDSVKIAKQRKEDSTARAKAQEIADRDAKALAAKQAASKPAVPPAAVSRVSPAVTAPPLAGGVLDLVLGEARSSVASASSAAKRFEDLAPTARVAYQRFAFEQILNKLRQVTPGNGIGFTRVKILSPGILVVDGETGTPAVLDELTRGLAAQSLVDTTSSTGPNGRFRVTARLPFSVAATADAPLAASFVTDLQKVIDLSTAQGLELSKSASQTTNAGSLRRASWKLSGTGTWDGCSRWIASMGGVGSPYGFTSLELSSGPDGRLRLVATAIAYGK